MSGLTQLRKAAKGMECQIRIPGICNFNTETTVLGHYRLPGICGTGIKPIDLIGSWSCYACHDAVDGRSKTAFKHDALRLMHAEGCLRTINELIKRGLII